MQNNCPFCPLEYLSTWWNYDGSILDEEILKQHRYTIQFSPWPWIVCRDLNDGGYKYRILIVKANWHVPRSGYAPGQEKQIIRLGKKVAIAHIANGWAKEIAHIDTEHMKYPEHYHIQICLK